MKVPSSLLRQTMLVERYAGNSSTGPTFDQAVSVRTRVEWRRRVVQSPTGVDVVVVGSAIIRPEDVARVTPQSKVTVDGRRAEVIDVLTHQGLTVPSHAEVVLQ